MDGVLAANPKVDISIRPDKKRKKKYTQIIKFRSTNGQLTKEVAIKAIGKMKHRYVVDALWRADLKKSFKAIE